MGSQSLLSLFAVSFIIWEEYAVFTVVQVTILKIMTLLHINGSK
jgi:hypothetical protein